MGNLCFYMLSEVQLPQAVSISDTRVGKAESINNTVIISTAAHVYLCLTDCLEAYGW